MSVVTDVLALDIGGTKVALAVVAPSGDIVRELVVPTASSPAAEEVWAPIAAGIVDLGLEARSWDVGIGSAGPVAAGPGTVSPVNIGAWRAFPLVDRVRAALTAATGHAPRTALAGDGHCIALGEHWLGAGRDVASMIGVVLSTGVGGGAILDDRLVAGSTGNAVHLGHISVNAWGNRCVCGGHGCVEMYARGPAMVAAAQARGWTGNDGIELTAAAAAGDRVAVETIEDGMRAAAAGIAATATELDIRRVVVGGGLAKAGEVIFAPLRRHLGDFAVLDYVRDLELRPAELPNAGLLGAASLALSLSGRGVLRARSGA